jgi:predicted GH43/DUF377 family glycosyl hydrolase
MKSVRFALVLLAPLLLARCSSSNSDLAPIEWQKVPGLGPNGSVLPLGPQGSFDEVSNFTISAFKDGDVYRLYYGGADSDTASTNPNCAGINGVHWRIGLATSSDGFNWTRVPGSDPAAKQALLDIGAAGKFDSYLTYRPYVIKDGSLYRMWYNGSAEPFNCPNNNLAVKRRIGYAESTDGVNFTRVYDGPGPGGSVLPLGGPGTIDEQQVGYPSIIKDGAEYKMYYSSSDTALFWRVALAVSTDARHWTKVPGNQTGGAILDIGPAGSFDVACAYEPSVVKERDGLYRMWYRGCQTPRPITGGPSLGVFGYAESSDGRTWVKVPQPGPQGSVALPVGAAGQFDSGGLATPAVFLDGNTWTMYYAAFDTNGLFLTGLARAPRR